MKNKFLIFLFLTVLLTSFNLQVFAEQNVIYNDDLYSFLYNSFFSVQTLNYSSGGQSFYFGQVYDDENIVISRSNDFYKFVNLNDNLLKMNSNLYTKDDFIIGWSFSDFDYHLSQFNEDLSFLWDYLDALSIKTIDLMLSYDNLGLKTINLEFEIPQDSNENILSFYKIPELLQILFPDIFNSAAVNTINERYENFTHKAFPESEKTELYEDIFLLNDISSDLYFNVSSLDNSDYMQMVFEIKNRESIQNSSLKFYSLLSQALNTLSLEKAIKRITKFDENLSSFFIEWETSEPNMRDLKFYFASEGITTITYSGEFFDYSAKDIAEDVALIFMKLLPDIFDESNSEILIKSIMTSLENEEILKINSLYFDGCKGAFFVYDSFEPSSVWSPEGSICIAITIGFAPII